MNPINIVMAFFAVIGALDRIFGNRFKLGEEFERGFMLLGKMALSMVGMIILAPYIADLLEPLFNWVYNTFSIDPSIIPVIVIANDMGGAALATEITKTPEIGMFNAMIVSAMMGSTISYVVPFALTTVKKEVTRELFLGMLCGFVTIPFAALISGVVMGLPFLPFLITLLPLFLFALLIVIGLLFAPDFTAKVFSIIGTCIKGLATIGLALGIIDVLLNKRLIQNVGEVQEGAWICFRAAITLSGAFPLMRIISLLLSKTLNWISRKTGLNSVSTMAFISTLVSSSTIFDTMHKMDKKGVFLNSAFLVSASFVVGGHLAFTMAYNADYVVPMILTKLLGGVMALALAIVLSKRLCPSEPQENTL